MSEDHPGDHFASTPSSSAGAIGSVGSAGPVGWSGPRGREALLWIGAAVATIVAGVVVARLDLTDWRVPLLAVGGILVGGAFLAGLDRLVALLGGLTYIVAVQLTYVDVVVPAYAYTGLVDPGADPLALVVVSSIAALPLVRLPIVLRRPSEMVIWLLYLVGYVPTCLMPIYVLGPDLRRVLPLEILVAIGFGGILAMERIPRIALPSLNLSQARFDRLALLIALASLVFLVLFFGIPTQIPDFSEIYDARADFGLTQAQVPGAGYVVAWAGNVVFPLIMAIGLTRRRIPWLVLGVAGELLIYSLQGSKAVLFAVALVPLLFVAIRWGRRRFGVWLAWAGVAAVGLSLFATSITGSLWPIAVGVVRLVALPGQLTSYYYDYFTTHEPYLLSHSILRAFTDAPYSVDPPFLIGGLYLHAVVDANANIWADSMANFGLPGILVFSAILGGVLWLLDSAAQRREFVIAGATVAVAAFTLANGALLTALLTNGIGLAIVMIALMPREPAGQDGSAPTAAAPTAPNPQLPVARPPRTF